MSRSAILERVSGFYPGEHALGGEQTGGKLNPAWDETKSPRFVAWGPRHDPDDQEDGGIWEYKIVVVDFKYLDDESFPIDTVAHDDSWAAAFYCVREYVHQALASDCCIFY